MRDRAGDVVRRASRQSKCVDCDSAASAAAGPPANRPPQRAPTRVGARQAPIPPCEPRSTPLPKRTSRAAASLEDRP